MNDADADASGDVEIYSCEICNQPFNDYGQLKVHLSLDHEVPMPFLMKLFSAFSDLGPM